MTRNLIVSPCGTSLLTNRATDEVRAFLGKKANAKENELSRDEKDQVLRRLCEKSAERLRKKSDRRFRIQDSKNTIPYAVRVDIRFLF